MTWTSTVLAGLERLVDVQRGARERVGVLPSFFRCRVSAGRAALQERGAEVEVVELDVDPCRPPSSSPCCWLSGQGHGLPGVAIDSELRRRPTVLSRCPADSDHRYTEQNQDLAHASNYERTAGGIAPRGIRGVRAHVQTEVWDASDETLLAGLATGDPDAALTFMRRFQRGCTVGAAVVGDGDGPRTWPRRHLSRVAARRGLRRPPGVGGDVAVHDHPQPRHRRAAGRASPPGRVVDVIDLPRRGAAGPDELAATTPKSPGRDRAHRSREQRRAVVLASLYGRTAQEISEIEGSRSGPPRRGSARDSSGCANGRPRRPEEMDCSVVARWRRVRARCSRAKSGRAIAHLDCAAGAAPSSRSRSRRPHSLLAPPAEPAAGFEERVLVGSSRGPRRSMRPPAWVVAAAAAVDDVEPRRGRCAVAATRGSSTISSWRHDAHAGGPTVGDVYVHTGDGTWCWSRCPDGPGAPARRPTTCYASRRRRPGVAYPGLRRRPGRWGTSLRRRRDVRELALVDGAGRVWCAAIGA